MRWPWSKPESREAVGGYTGIISALIGAQAAGTTQQASATAALEACAGALSRSFMAAKVEAPPDIAEAVSPRTLGQIGRDLVRVGESLHVIRTMGGKLRLIPSSTWYWEGDADPSTWLCTATSYGPSGSSTWRLPMDSVVYIAWGSPTARPYHGLSPSSWSADTSRLMANTERALADEAGGPVAQLLPVPQDGGEGGEGDPLAGLKSDIKDAKGSALLVETTSAGWGEGKVAAPTSDWKQSRLGPMPPDSMVKLADSAFSRVLAAAGVPPSLFVDDADGTAQREGLRRYHLGTVVPLARLLEAELSEKFNSMVKLQFDGYARDMVSRAQVFAKLAAVDGISPELALELSGMLGDD